MTATTRSADRAWSLNVLGPVELSFEGRVVEVTGTAHTVLALLARSPGDEISTATIVAALWGGELPEDCEKEVASNVSRLRKALTVVAPDVDPTSVVVTRPHGYILAIGPANVDMLAFERLVAEGRRALSVGQPRLAAARFESALALWRGPAYADLVDHPFGEACEPNIGLSGEACEPNIGLSVRAEATRLEKLRLAAMESSAVIASDPAVVDPAVVDPAATTVPQELAATVPACVGREEEVGWLLAAIDLAATRRAQARLIVGPAGIGKTRLVAEVAQRAAQRGVMVWHRQARASGLDGLAIPDRVSLVVIDDLDQAAQEDLATVATIVRSAATRPLVVLATCRDPARIGDLQRMPKLVLSPLDQYAIAEIVRVYAPATTDAKAVAAMADTGGVPARVHGAASAWARGRAGRRIDRAVADAQEPRRRLADLEDEVVAGALDLAHVREQSRHTGHGPAPAVAYPYKGLAVFQPEDADIFHGRELLVAELVARLIRAPLLAVVGPVGSGKSSLVRAGLLPAIAAGILPGSASWRQILLTPTDATTATLASRTADTALTEPLAPPPAEPANEQEPDDQEPDDQEPDDQADRRNFLVVDHLEEAFTVLDADGRAAFLDTLVEAALCGHVVVTLRSDFYARCAEHPELARLITANTVLVRPMEPAEVRRAIELPAAVAGLCLEDGLVDLMIDDVMRTPENLAHLSCSLRSVWEGRSGDRLTIASYQRHGGVEAFAERAFAALSSDEDRDAARRILLGLTATVDDRIMVRRQATRAELLAAAGAGGARALETLARRRLVTIDGDAIDLAHNALLEHWPRLRTWVDDRTADHGLRRHLAHTASRWSELGRAGTELYEGARLAAALELAREHPTELTTAEHDFLGASQQVMLAAEIRRRRREVLLRRWLAAAVGVAVIALTVAVVAVTMQARASANAVRADAQRLAAQALIEPDIRRALLLAVAASELDAGTAGNIHTTLRRTPELMAAAGTAVTAVALSPDGRSVATGSSAGTIWVYTAETLRPTVRLDGHGPVNGLAFTPDGRRLVSWGGDRTADGAGIAVWDLAARQPVGPTFGQAWPGVGGGLASDGETLLVMQHGIDASKPPTIVAWSLQSRTPSTAYELPTTGVDALVVSAGGRYVAVGTAKETLVLEPATAARTQIRGALRPLALSPDGRTLLTADGGKVAVWNAASGARAAEGDRHMGEILAAAWALDGRTFATAGADGLVVVWDARTLHPTSAFTGHGGAARLVRFAGDGRTLYTAGSDGSLLAWDLTGTRGAGIAPASDGIASDKTLACALAGRDMTPEEWRAYLPHRAYQRVCVT